MSSETTSTPDFIKVTLKNIDSQKEEEVSQFLLDSKAQGVSQSLSFKQESQQYDPEILEEETLSLEAYFLPEDWSKCSDEIMNTYEVEVSFEKNKDWLEEWKKHYEPFEVYKNLWIYPSWYQGEENKAHEIIWIEPGMAFGTGTHATTQLCLQALENCLANTQEEDLKTALDMGSGSSVLSIYLKKRGFEKVVPCEIDPLARENGQFNLNLNGFEETKVVAPEILKTNDTCDLVVANIIDGVLLKLRDQLYSFRPKYLVLSGILRENFDRLKDEFQEQGYICFSETFKEEWSCLVFQRT